MGIELIYLPTYSSNLFIRLESKKISSAIGELKHMRPLISEHTALQIYQALILPHFDYCSSVWGDCMQLNLKW